MHIDGTTATRTRMLVVGPEGLLRELVELECVDNGCAVESASSLEAAIEAVDAQSYDVVLVDSRLPDGGLRAVLAVGRATRPEARYVVLVPFHDRAALGDALSLGPYACLRVPFTAGDLRALIRMACGAARGGRASADRPRRPRSPPGPGAPARR